MMRLAMHTYDDHFRGKAVLITGGAGFIGSHLAHRLVALGADVRVLDDLSGGFRENLPRGATLTEHSILDDAALRQAMDGCDYVFHQAALVSVPQSVEEPDQCLQINIVGTQRVLEAARDLGVKRVLFAASAAAYGGTPNLPSRETDAPDSYSPYAASKVAGEQLLAAFARSYGMSTISLRYFNIFGPRQDPNSPYAAVISAFSKRLLAREQPSVFGDGTQTRDFTYVDNVVHANLLAASSDKPLAGEVVNIGTGRRISLLDVLRVMGEVLAFEVKPTFGPPRAGDVPHSQADISAARTVLGYEPIVTFEEGIKHLLECETSNVY
jgi:UDP-glucose 4-epimerase